MRILVVEDERGIAAFLSQGLREAGYAVDTAADGQAGLDAAMIVDFDLFILDLMLPRLDGLSLLRRLRCSGKMAPVLLLTARDAIEDRVSGLDAGADDYLMKPFAFPELLARVRALLRRPANADDVVVSVGSLELDAARKEIRRDGTALDLSAREYGILEYFMRNPGRTLTREQVEEHVWNFDAGLGSNIVDVYVGYLRRKLDDKAGRTLRTVRGLGYRLEAPDAQ